MAHDQQKLSTQYVYLFSTFIRSEFYEGNRLQLSPHTSYALEEDISDRLPIIRPAFSPRSPVNQSKTYISKSFLHQTATEMESYQ